MEKNKTGKYLKYAIGEIILVVVGILIALSINNWNEANKNKALERGFIHNLISDFESDVKQINEVIKILPVMGKTSKIKDNDLINLLQYYDLIEELETTHVQI